MNSFYNFLIDNNLLFIFNPENQPYYPRSIYLQLTGIIPAILREHSEMLINSEDEMIRECYRLAMNQQGNFNPPSIEELNISW